MWEHDEQRKTTKVSFVWWLCSKEARRLTKLFNFADAIINLVSSSSHIFKFDYILTRWSGTLLQAIIFANAFIDTGCHLAISLTLKESSIWKHPNREQISPLRCIYCYNRMQYLLVLADVIFIIQEMELQWAWSH